MLLQMRLTRPTTMITIMINERMMIRIRIMIMVMQTGHKRTDGQAVFKSRRTSPRLEH